MRVQPLVKLNVSFKSQQEEKESGTKVHGYDGEVSQYLRQHVIRPRVEVGETNTFEKYGGRLSEFELNKLLGFLLAKPKVVSDKAVRDIDAYGVSSFGKNCYSGSTLYNKPYELKKLKKAGIERVIDLCGYSNYEENCKKAGLEYYSFFEAGIWKGCAGIDKKEYLDEKRYDYSCYGYDEEAIKELIENADKIFDKSSAGFIEDLIGLVNTINKGYVYMGCQLGTHDTTDVLFLNKLFNPKFEKDIYDFPFSSKGREGAAADARFVSNLYNKLTDEHKKRMGWDKGFDERLKEKIERRTLYRK